MNSILLSKLLFQKAVSSYVPSDPFSHGLTVSLLQDSAEMLVWAIIKDANANVKSKDGFVSLIENIDKNYGGIELKPQIFELNSARVNFKHYGNIPSNTDIPKYISSCREFLSLNAKKLGVNFDEVSASDSVITPEIKQRLKESELHIENDRASEALVETSIAFQELEKKAYSNLSIDESALDQMREAYEIWPKENQESAREFTYNLTDTLEHTIKHLSLGQFGYTPDYVLSIKSLCYRVNISVGGNILGVINNGGVKEEIDSVVFINNFIIEASRRLGI